MRPDVEQPVLSFYIDTQTRQMPQPIIHWLPGGTEVIRTIDAGVGRGVDRSRYLVVSKIMSHMFDSCHIPGEILISTFHCAAE